MSIIRGNVVLEYLILNRVGPFKNSVENNNTLDISVMLLN